MNDAGIQTGGGEGALDGAMIAPGAFDRDQQIVQLVIANGLTELIDRGLERRSIVSKKGRTHDDVAVEIGKHPFGARLGAINRDDAKMFGTNLLDARMKRAAGLLHDIDATGTRALASRMCHGNRLRNWGEGHPNS